MNYRLYEDLCVNIYHNNNNYTPSSTLTTTVTTTNSVIITINKKNSNNDIFNDKNVSSGNDNIFFSFRIIVMVISCLKEKRKNQGR